MLPKARKGHIRNQVTPCQVQKVVHVSLYRSNDGIAFIEGKWQRGKKQQKYYATNKPYR